MYRVKRGLKIVALLLITILVMLLIFFSLKNPSTATVPNSEEPLSLSHLHVLEAVRRELARNKPQGSSDMWYKRTVNHDKVYLEQYKIHDEEMDFQLEMEQGRYVESENQDSNGVGDKENEATTIVTTIVVRRPNNGTDDKELATISKPHKFVSDSQLNRPVQTLGDEPTFHNDQDSPYQPSLEATQLKQNPPTHLPTDVHRLDSNPSVHSQSKLSLPHQRDNPRNLPAANKHQANFQHKNAPAYPISHRNYSKVYNEYILQRKNKRLAEIKEEQRKKIAAQNLLKNNCQGTKYCLAGIPQDIRWMHDECFVEALKDHNRSKIELNQCKCELLKSTDEFSKANVGLVSLAGSGNTWLRGLLEKATNVCTASMWCDPVLRAKDFCAEALHTSLALAIKNHDPTVRWRGQRIPKGGSNYNKPAFDIVVFLHRDPYEAMIAEWNRALGEHVRTATLHYKNVPLKYKILSSSSDQHKAYFGKEAFGDDPDWEREVRRQIANWEEMVTHLIIRSADKPVLVVRYEDLRHDAVGQVKRILKFLRFDQFTEQEIESRLETGFQSYHRNHSADAFDHYTQDQKTYVNSVIRRVEQKISQHGIDQFIPLSNYIRE